MADAFLMGQSGISKNKLIQSYFTTFIERTHPSNTFNGFWGVAYGNGMFAAVGENIITSTDGITWTNRTNPGYDLFCITYGNGTFVAGGYSGNLVSSTDGITWTKRTNPGQNIYGVAYGNSVFVIACALGVIYSSPDGITWTKRTAPNTDHYDNVRFINGKFVITGTNGKLITSTNGTTWTLQSVSPSKNFYDVCYDNGKYVGVTSTSSLISTDLVTWTDEKPIVWYSSSNNCPSALATIKYFDGFGFVTLGKISQYLTGSFFVSPDGINWESRLGGFQKMIYPMDICYGNGKFVLCGYAMDTDSSYIATLTL